MGQLARMPAPIVVLLRTENIGVRVPRREHNIARHHSRLVQYLIFASLLKRMIIKTFFAIRPNQVNRVQTWSVGLTENSVTNGLEL